VEIVGGNIFLQERKSVINAWS